MSDNYIASLQSVMIRMVKDGLTVDDIEDLIDLAWTEVYDDYILPPLEDEEIQDYLYSLEEEEDQAYLDYLND